jgi:hypothetical protein
MARLLMCGGRMACPIRQAIQHTGNDNNKVGGGEQHLGLIVDLIRSLWFSCSITTSDIPLVGLSQDWLQLDHIEAGWRGGGSDASPSHRHLYQ